MLALAPLVSSAAPAVAKQHQLLPEQNGWSWEFNDVSRGAQTANHDFGRALAHSGFMARAFTCYASDAKKSCPGAARLEFEYNHVEALKPQPNAKWLFYGPSYMEQFFATVAAANADDVVGYENLRAKYNETDFKMDLECSPPWKQQEMLAEKAREEEQARVAEQAKREQEQARQQAMQNGEEVPAEEDEQEEETPFVPDYTWTTYPGCNSVAATTAGNDCRTTSGVAIKLKNGAMLYSVTNLRLFQHESSSESMDVLRDFMKTSERKFDRIFYMPPHSSTYNQAHCDAVREQREVDKAGAKQGVDLCYLASPPNFEKKWRNDATPTTLPEFMQCAENLPSYQIILNHAQAAGSVLQVVAPWEINPRGFKPRGGGVSRGGQVYSPFATGHKYACVTGDTAGSHYALCDLGWQLGHPCAVICEADGNGAASDHSNCIPGPAAKMAIEMVMLSSGTSVSAEYDPDWIDFTDTLMNTTSGCKTCYSEPDDYTTACVQGAGCEVCIP